jgi:hypothetical protein
MCERAIETKATTCSELRAVCFTPIWAHPERSGNSHRDTPMSKYTAFRCPEDLLELAKVKAKKDRRSLSNYIITLIEKDVKEMVSPEEAAKLGQKKR